MQAAHCNIPNQVLVTEASSAHPEQFWAWFLASSLCCHSHSLGLGSSQCEAGPLLWPSGAAESCTPYPSRLSHLLTFWSALFPSQSSKIPCALFAGAGHALTLGTLLAAVWVCDCFERWQTWVTAGKKVSFILYGRVSEMCRSQSSLCCLCVWKLPREKLFMQNQEELQLYRSVMPQPVLKYPHNFYEILGM